MPSSYAQSVGALTEAGLNDLVSQGCSACKSKRFLFRAVVDGRLPLMAGEPVGAITWIYDGEKFVDGVFEVHCDTCKKVVFASDVCPRCNAPDALSKVLSTCNGWPVPAACPACQDEEVRYVALLPVEVVHDGQRASKARTSTEMHDPGFHGISIDCVDCGVVAPSSDATNASCPLCAAPGPIRARP